VTTTQLLEPHSPVRTFLALFPDTEELPVPQLDSAQLQTAFQWVEDHRQGDYQLAVDRVTNQRVPVCLSERDRKVVEGKGAGLLRRHARGGTVPGHPLPTPGPQPDPGRHAQGHDAGGGAPLPRRPPPPEPGAARRQEEGRLGRILMG